MSTARMSTQLFAKMPTRVGLLADVTDSIRRAGVNITAIGAYEKEGRGEFMLVTDDNAKAMEALKRLDADVVEQEVVAVDLPNRPGALEDVSRSIAQAGINVEYVYATAGGGDTATAIFRTTDNAQVVVLING